jgi:hypothetical protein
LATTGLEQFPDPLAKQKCLRNDIALTAIRPLLKEAAADLSLRFKLF